MISKEPWQRAREVGYHGPFLCADGAQQVETNPPVSTLSKIAMCSPPSDAPSGGRGLWGFAILFWFVAGVFGIASTLQRVTWLEYLGLGIAFLWGGFGAVVAYIGSRVGHGTAQSLEVSSEGVVIYYPRGLARSLPWSWKGFHLQFVVSKSSDSSESIVYQPATFRWPGCWMSLDALQALKAEATKRGLSIQETPADLPGTSWVKIRRETT